MKPLIALVPDWKPGVDELDDGFAPAHAQLAIATAFLGLRGEVGLEEITTIAVPHLDRAEALAPNLAEVRNNFV